MPKLKEGIVLAERYRLLNRVGQGGFSVVWLAEDIQSRLARVAVKVFLPQQGLDDASLQTFKKEYELTKPLVDARLLRSTDYFVFEESPCLVFPFMQGGSLADKIKEQGHFDEMEIAKLMYQIGGALEYLHSRSPAPILHLDIKPENILINYAGEYLLADFGISYQLRSTMMRASALKGVSMHRAPEQILNKGLGTKVDIFTLGVTLVECVNGLFEGNYLPGFAVISGSPKPKLERGAKRLEGWLHACMNLNPADRPNAKTITAVGDFYIKNKKWPEPPADVTPAPQGRETQPVHGYSSPSPTPTPVAPPPPVRRHSPPPKPQVQRKQERKKRSALPWLLGISGVILIGIVVIFIMGQNQPETVYFPPEPVEEIPTYSPPEPLPARVTTDGSLLMLRDGPSMDANVIAKMPYFSEVFVEAYIGDYVYVQGERGKWCLIEFEGMKGYAFGTHLTLESDLD